MHRVAIAEIPIRSPSVCHDIQGVPGVAPLEGVQYSSLDLAGIPILLNRPDNLDSTVFSSVPIKTFHDLSKGALSQQSDHFVYIDTNNTESVSDEPQSP